MTKEPQTTKVWKPIKTFPKRKMCGLAVLVYCPCNLCQFTAIYTVVGIGSRARMKWCYWGPEAQDEFVIPFEISHWMELPDDPV